MPPKHKSTIKHNAPALGSRNAPINVDSSSDKEEAEASELEQCAVCFNDVAIRGAIECGHYFCYRCIDTWSKTANTCPVCRSKFHQIRKVQVELKDGKRIETDLHERRPVADTEQTLDPVYLGLNLITLGAPFVPPTAAARQMRPQAIQHVNPFNQNGIMNTLQRAWADFELHGDVFMADVSDEPSDDDDDDAGVIYLGNGDDEVNVRVIFEDDNASRRRRQPTAAPAPARRTRRMAPDTTDRENLEHSRTHRRRTILHDNDEHVQHVARHTPPRPHRAAQPTLPRVFTGPLPDSVRRLMPHLEQRFTVPDEAPNRTRRTGRRRTP